MRTFGIDFSVAKPITCAGCTLRGSDQKVDRVEEFEGFLDFERLLARSGPWVAGIDFPFGQPWKLVTNFGLTTGWTSYVQAMQGWGETGFKQRIDEYREHRPAGDKEHLRVTDALADSRSPMKFVKPPVARMFFRGVQRLIEAGVSVAPCREIPDERRVVVEAYPALVARRFASKYKSDDPRKQTPEQEGARREILLGLGGQRLHEEFGLRVHVDADEGERVVEDGTGDLLDAVLCAVQSAWSYTKKQQGYGVPLRTHPVIRSEGWIVDPRLVAGRTPAVGSQNWVVDR